MTLTTTAFMGMLFFQFVGCQLNAFMVNSHRSLMYGNLVLPCMKSSLLQKNSHTMTCQISRSLRMHSKGTIAHYCCKILSKPDMCPLEVYEIMLKCWAHNSNSEPHLRNSFIYSPLFSVVLYHLMIYNIACIFLCLDFVYCFKVYSNE